MHKIPSSVHFNQYKPVLKPEEDLVIINKNQKLYRLFGENTYKYNSGEMDKFRLRVQIEDKTEQLIFKFKINVYSRIVNKTTKIESDKTYFIASHSGPTIEQFEEKTKENNSVVELSLSDSSKISHLQIIKKLQEGNVQEAVKMLDLRIDFLKELLSLRREIDDGNPSLVGCLYLRIYCSLYLCDKNGATKDIDFIKNVLKRTDIDGIQNLDNIIIEYSDNREKALKFLIYLSIKISENKKGAHNFKIIRTVR